MTIAELVEEAMVNRTAERPYEYSFVFRFLAPLLALPPRLRRSVRILDVGCCESRLSSVLARLGFSVTGIDIRECDIRPARLVQANILSIDFGPEAFDVIIAISTVEHVGLPCYGQKLLDDDGDVKTMERIYRWLRSGGVALVTVPFGKPHHPPTFERVYDYATLEQRIIRGFELVHMEIWCNFADGGDAWMLCSLGDNDPECLRHDCAAMLLLRKPA